MTKISDGIDLKKMLQKSQYMFLNGIHETETLNIRKVRRQLDKFTGHLAVIHIFDWSLDFDLPATRNVTYTRDCDLKKTLG